jgi:hypothetical protein
LESLTIAGNDYSLDNEHVMEMTYALRKNSTLRKLTMEPPMIMKTLKHLAFSLRANGALEELKIFVLAGSRHDANDAVHEFARTLHLNTFLRSIWNLNYSNMKVNDKVCRRLIKSFSENHTLQEFLLFEEEPAFHCAKVDFMQQNKKYSQPVLSDMPELLGCPNFASAAQRLDDGEDKEDDDDGNDGEFSVVESVIHDYAAIGNSIARLGSNIKNHGEALAEGVWDTFELMGKAVGIASSKKG